MIGLVLLARLSASGITACPVTLAWNQSANNMVAGYAVYFAPANSTAYTRVDTGMSNSVTLSGFATGTTYSFYVVAYDANGQESDPSNQLTYSPPAITPVRCKKVSGQLAVQFRSAPGALCQIQYKDSMAPNELVLSGKRYVETNPWLLLGSTYSDANGNVSIVDPTASQVPCRIYRAVRY